MKNMLTGGSLTVMAACLAVSFIATQASAQDTQANAEQPSNNVIIVTAKGYKQDLQDVPLPITVFNADRLDELGVTDVRDLANFTPNFNIFSGSGRQDATALNIRGLSANTSDERYQPVSFFLDGIFLGGVTVGLQTADLARVEVIKGPQSATFGRATYAGAIDFVSTTPSLNSFGGKLKAQISSHNFDNLSHEVSGYLEGPIIPGRLSASVFFLKTRKDGFDTALNAQFDEVGQEDTLAINAVVYAQLTDNTSLKLRAIYSEDNDQESIGYSTQPFEWQLGGANIITLPSGALFVDGPLPKPLRDGVRGPDAVVTCVANPCAPGYERKRLFLSAIFEHEFNSGMILSYRGGYLDNSYDANPDFRNRTLVGIDPIYGSTLPLRSGETSLNFLLPFPYQEDFVDTSHQIRLSSSGTDQLRWSFGAYYYWSVDSNYAERTDIVTAGNPRRQTRGDENIINKAIFASLAYDLSDKFTVGFEGRLQRERVDFDQLMTSATTSAIPESDLSTSIDSFEPRITVEFKPNDDQLFYALFAKGLKSGRYNTTGGVTFPVGDPRRGPNGNFRPNAGFVYAPPEKLFNYEIGSKSTFADGDVILNMAAFYQNVKDQQLRQTVTIGGDFNNDGIPDQVNQIFTAGDSEIYGFEIESVVRASEKLTLRAAVGYSHHQFVDDIKPSADFDIFAYVDGVGKETLKGKTSAGVPRWTGNISADYSTPISNKLDWNIRADAIYTGSKFAELANLAELPEYVIVNVRTSISNGDWTFSIFSNNLLDDRSAIGTNVSGTSDCEYRRNGPNLPNYNNAQRCTFLVPGTGREIGASIKFKF